MSDWLVCAASVRGTSHVRDDVPCQDAHGASFVTSAGTEVLVLVASDGAGSAIRGGDGSSMVTKRIVDLVTERAGDLSRATAVEILRGAVASARKSLAEAADREALPIRQFACTALCCVLAPDWSAFAQIGDGAIVTPEDGTDEWNWIFWPQRGEYANTTSFLTDEQALSEVQLEFLPYGVQEIALFTDGIQHLVLHYESQTVHGRFFEQIMEPPRRAAARGVSSALSRSLATYLSSPRIIDRADDDLTLVLATRSNRAGDA
ncbi:MAG: protein phosphatase 2C domain-containing protein [Actinobacteria bacterium]|nr:protein phosphatase 2C domain-containing protein [Actinomycetota bacterium]